MLIEVLQLEEIRGFGQGYNNIRQSFISNKFLAKLLSSSSGLGRDALHGRDLSQGLLFSSSSGGGSTSSRDKLLVNKMIAQSLKCLNQILRMSVQSEIADVVPTGIKSVSEKALKDHRGVKLYYVQQLNCVKEMRQQLLEPQTQVKLPLKCNMVNLMAFYAKLEYNTSLAESASAGSADQGGGFQVAAHRHLLIDNNRLAAEFLKLACQLW